ncbi:MAG: hypothetical protein IJA02_02770 [Clostridia bacterium]|nr:hypothetical protein [Clostridia bacterium]
MGKNIIIAGLGHGGIAVAAILAQNGYNVTVYEKQSEGTLGYDWTDIFAPEALKIAGMPMPPQEKYEYKEHMTFFAPTSKRTLTQRVPDDKLEIKMERKDIYAHFINHAVNCGVNIIYDCMVTAPITLGSRVIGIKTDKGDYYADLIIDACGMNSPVRSNLPDSFGIEKQVKREEKITIFRAFYNKASDIEVEAKFRVMLFAGGKKSISWVASENEHTDLLVGRFEEFTIEELNEYADFLRKSCPRLGKEIVRGGQFVEIPVRHPLSVMVADGYAAIGDSAFMTVPLIGSGIANSLKAARMLADTIIADKAEDYNASTLWSYQLNYFRKIATNMAPLECVKYFLLNATPDELDYCFDSGMLNEDNITMTADFGGIFDLFKPDVKDMIVKAKGAIKNPKLLVKILDCGAKLAAATAICAAIPTKWDKKKVMAWAEKYAKPFH